MCKVIGIRPARDLDGQLGAQEFRAGAIAPLFQFRQRRAQVLHPPFQCRGLLAKTGDLGLGHRQLFRCGPRASIEFRGSCIEWRDLLGDVAIGFGPVGRDSLLMRFDCGPRLGNPISRGRGGGVELGANRAQMGNLLRELRAFALEGPVLLRVAVLDATNEPSGKFPGTPAGGGRIAMCSGGFREEALDFGAVGGKPLAFSAQGGAGIGQRLLALRQSPFAVVQLVGHARISPISRNLSSLSSREGGEVGQKRRTRNERGKWPQMNTDKHRSNQKSEIRSQRPERKP